MSPSTYLYSTHLYPVDRDMYMSLSTGYKCVE
jgi:hypothetical protein